MAGKILDIARSKVAVELTNRCNLRCGMCPMNNLGRPDADMPWWLVEKVAKEFHDNGVKVSWLHEMGDPLLYPRLCEAIDLFPGCSVSTNAVILDEDYAKEIIGTSLQRIRLCIDTLDPRIYPNVRRGGIYEEVIANIKTFLELSKGSDIKVEIQKMITLQTSHETKAQFHEFFNLDQYPQAYVIEKTCEGLDTSDATDLHEAYYGCFQGYPFRWFIVLADGRVTHCCYDSDGAQPIGDMKTQSMAEVLDSPVISDYMEAFKSKDWATLPRCGECYKNSSGKAVVVDQLIQLGHKIDRALPTEPVKKIARRIINH